MKNLIGWVFLIFGFIANAQQNIGKPNIINYFHTEIGAGSQTWQIKQDRIGTLYFANNSGLLTYNGREWKLFRLPNKTIVRSIYIAKDDKIYVGGQGEIGYFAVNDKGFLQYKSLNILIPPKASLFEDVWNVTEFKNEIYFNASKYIFKYDLKNKIAVIPNKENRLWASLNTANNKLFIQNGLRTLIVYNDNSGIELNNPEIVTNLITSLIPISKDTLLISTLYNGLFYIVHNEPKRFKIAQEIIDSRIFTTTVIDKNTIAIGTVSNGVYFIDNSGQIIKHFSTKNGLQNNNILSLKNDSNGNLWVGMDEGLAIIDYNSAIQTISPTEVLSPCYTASYFKGKLYIGTSDGLYSATLTKPASVDLATIKASFNKMQNLGRQVWNIQTLNDRLLMGHHDGAYEIVDSRAHRIGNNYVGSWIYRKIPVNNLIVTGSYNGLKAYSFNAKNIKEDTSFTNKNINESLRFIEVDSAHQVIWASHPYRGVYQLSMMPGFKSISSIRLFTPKGGLPSSLNNFVFKLSNEIVFTTENGIYEFDYTKNLFIKSVKYDPLFKNHLVKFLVLDAKGRIWFATENRMGVVDNNTLTYLPEFDNKLIAGFENINPINDENILIGSYKGILHLNYTKYKKERSKTKCILNKVVAIGKYDSLLYAGYFTENEMITEQQPKNMVYRMSSRFNSFHFEYGSNAYNSDEKTVYSYKLQGFDDGWSAWSTKKDKDYTNLPYGKYTFWVKAGDSGNQSEPIFYSFEILPKWYQTQIAYVTYLLLFVSVVYWINDLQKRRLKRQKEKFLAEQSHLKYVHELELEHNENVIVQLKNERLETEMAYKNKELASTTMHLYKRGRLLGKIKEDITNATKKLVTKDEKSDFIKLMKLIDFEEKQDNDWDQFAIHFDDVHNKFLQKLKSAYPDLSSTDMKVCAYLKMNLSSKEIAQLLNISLKGVEIARYRLRKKLRLHPDVNLTAFINEVV